MNAEEVAFTLKSLVGLGLSAIAANQGALLVVDEGGAVLHFKFVISLNGLRRHEVVFNRLAGKTVPIGEGITGRAALTREAQFASANESGDFYRISGDGVPAAVLAVPLVCDGNLHGVMTAISFDCDHEFTGEDAAKYGQYAAIAGIVLKDAAAVSWGG